MKTISSAEFRKTYARLREPVEVTALGHIIGHWQPVLYALPGGVQATVQAVEDTRRTILGMYPKAQAERDAILRKINRGG